MTDRFVMYRGKEQYAAVVKALVDMGFYAHFATESPLTPDYEDGYIRVGPGGRMSYGSKEFFNEEYKGIEAENIYNAEFFYSAKLSLPEPKLVEIGGSKYREADIRKLIYEWDVVPYATEQDIADGLPC